MAVTYTDTEIANLIGEPKGSPSGWRQRLQFRPKRGHDEWQTEISEANGNVFDLIIRRSQTDPNDFSIILAVRVSQSNRKFHLLRYDGNSHAHTNKIEHETFTDFHIHVATERYQARGFREDAFAEPTSRYSDLAGAAWREPWSRIS